MKMKPLILLFVVAALAGCASNQVAQSSAQGVRTENCKAVSEAEIASLFDRWNQSLQTGDPHKVSPTMRSGQSFCLLFQTNLGSLQPRKKTISITFWRTVLLEKLTCDSLNWAVTLPLMPVFTHSRLPRQGPRSVDATAIPIVGMVQSG